MQNDIVSLMDGPCATVMIQGGRKTWNLNLRLGFVFLVHCARYIVKEMTSPLEKPSLLSQ